MRGTLGNIWFCTGLLNCVEEKRRWAREILGHFSINADEE
jgi:hypothetical protein